MLVFQNRRVGVGEAFPDRLLKREIIHGLAELAALKQKPSYSEEAARDGDLEFSDIGVSKSQFLMDRERPPV